MEGEKLTAVSGEKSSHTSAEPALASPRSIPVPQSPTRSESPAFPSATEDSGKPSNSSDKQCAYSQAPECVSGNYDHLSYNQIRDICKARGYHKRDAKAALKTSLETMDEVERQLTKRTQHDMDTSSSFSGKRDRSMVEQAAMEHNQQQVEGKRSRGDAPAITMEVDLAVAQAHAQWRSPELKPKL